MGATSNTQGPLCLLHFYDVFAERCCHACAQDASHEFRLHTLSNCSSSSEEQSVVCLHQDQHPATLLIPVDSSREEKNLLGDTTDSIATTRTEDTWSSFQRNTTNRYETSVIVSLHRCKAAQPVK